MSKPIQVGDLVVVIRPTPCCGKLGNAYGRVFVLTAIYTNLTYCAHCGKTDNIPYAEGLGNLRPSLGRLKRIPPLSELEGQRTEETLKETA